MKKHRAERMEFKNYYSALESASKMKISVALNYSIYSVIEQGKKINTYIRMI